MTLQFELKEMKKFKETLSNYYLRQNDESNKIHTDWSYIRYEVICKLMDSTLTDEITKSLRLEL